MMELPGYGKNFGLGPRTFRKRNMPDMSDRSEWTDTPADKERKARVICDDIKLNESELARID